MAEKRMFAMTIIDSDAFLDMPPSTQALYFHLNMRADDDGFINNPKKIQKMVGSSDDDLKLLIAKSFIIPFESGIVVIKHWKIHNYIRSDRKKSTVYAEEYALLDIKDNGAYTLSDNLSVDCLSGRCQAFDSQMTVKCQANDGQMSGRCQADVRIDKISIDKSSIDKISISDSKESDCQKPQADFRHAIELWNSLEDLGIKPVSRIDPSAKRFEMLRARIRQYGMKEYENAINRIRGSDFLQGKHSGRPWQITFDWFVKPNNFPKVLEGNYDNAAHIYGDILDNIS